jgi:hypothetical protein
MLARMTALAAVVAALVCAGCTCCAVPTAPQLTAPPGAITRDAAIAAALRGAPATSVDPKVGWAIVRTNPFVGSDSEQLVWQVSLLAPFAVPSCAPSVFDRTPVQSDAPCMVNDGLQAVVDIYSGELLGWIPNG